MSKKREAGPAGYAVYRQGDDGKWSELPGAWRYPSEDHARRVAYQQSRSTQIRYFAEATTTHGDDTFELIEEIDRSKAGDVRRMEEFGQQEEDQKQAEHQRWLDSLEWSRSVRAESRQQARAHWRKWVDWARERAGRMFLPGPVKRKDRCYNCGRKPHFVSDWSGRECPVCYQSICRKWRCASQHFGCCHPETHNLMADETNPVCPCPTCKGERGSVVNQRVSEAIASGVF